MTSSRERYFDRFELRGTSISFSKSGPKQQKAWNGILEILLPVNDLDSVLVCLGIMSGIADRRKVAVSRPYYARSGVTPALGAQSVRHLLSVIDDGYMKVSRKTSVGSESKSEKKEGGGGRSAPPWRDVEDDARGVTCNEHAPFNRETRG